MRVHFSGWTLDSDAHELRRAGGDPVPLSPKAFRLLEVLIEGRPAAISRERLFELVWPGVFVAESNLASLIKEIRTALQDDARDPKLIGTVFRFGYRFLGEAAVEARPPGRPQSIAVLPFQNAAGSEWEYLSEGMAEALLNALVRLPALRVVPRSTSFRYRSPELDVGSAAREMRVDAIVTGRFAARDELLTVQLELVDARTDSQVWGGRFQRRRSEVLQLESEITASILEQAGLGDDRRRDARPRRTRPIGTFSSDGIISIGAMRKGSGMPSSRSGAPSRSSPRSPSPRRRWPKRMPRSGTARSTRRRRSSRWRERRRRVPLPSIHRSPRRTAPSRRRTSCSTGTGRAPRRRIEPRWASSRGMRPPHSGLRSTGLAARFTPRPRAGSTARWRWSRSRR